MDWIQGLRSLSLKTARAIKEIASDVVSTMSTKRVYFLSTSYSMQEDLQGLLSRLAAYEDRYLENRAQDSTQLSSTESYIRALDRTIRAEESLCEQYRLVTEDFTGREVSSEGQCGGGAFVVSQKLPPWLILGLAFPVWPGTRLSQIGQCWAGGGGIPLGRLRPSVD